LARGHFSNFGVELALPGDFFGAGIFFGGVFLTAISFSGEFFRL
jgi:hypothetical protein